MNCPHHFKAGAIVKFGRGGSCDMCGSPIEPDGHWGYYLGDNSRGHSFLCTPPVLCPGCQRWLPKMNIICGDGWRVPQLEREKELVK